MYTPRFPVHRSLGWRSVFLAVATCTLTPQAFAASLQKVQDWNGAGFPSDVSMYAYVPDQVVENPPLLVLIHYCGGTASAVFGQAQGGGVVQAADQYGFVIVAPSSGRCWDVVSDKTRTRDGSGDSHARPAFRTAPNLERCLRLPSPRRVHLTRG